jgi:hypothetical protein
VDGVEAAPRRLMAKLRSGSGRDILIEIVTLGTYAKVTAIDSLTGTEISLTAPSNAPRASLEAAAVNKLEFVLKKKAAETK